jgi:hypothetical protein
MSVWLRAILIGIGMWAMPFVLGALLMPVLSPESQLFDTLMSIAVAAVAAGGALRFLSRHPNPTARLGALAGTFWAMMALALDSAFFLFGPAEMRMSVADYGAKIGAGYLVIPIVTAGLGAAMTRAAERRSP